MSALSRGPPLATGVSLELVLLCGIQFSGDSRLDVHLFGVFSLKSSWFFLSL